MKPPLYLVLMKPALFKFFLMKALYLDNKIYFIIFSSGNNQRKGCLWALNPNKAHKMDEEVQKWNKKDLQGIKDAMSMPGE